MSIEISINPAITDLSISRERVWIRMNARNRFGCRVMQDTGVDAVLYENFGEGFEAGVDNSEARADGKVSDRKYTGMRVLEEDDPVANVLLRSGFRATTL